MTITLYDIPSATPEIAFSPNTWKIRLVLNYKRLPYKTEWIEYPDIEPRSRSLGLQPTSVKEDGRTTHYTLPAIHDAATGVYISDSLRIAEYLEATYPAIPAPTPAPTPGLAPGASTGGALFPHNTLPLQAAFTDAFAAHFEAARPFIHQAVYFKLNPASQPFFLRTRAPKYGGRPPSEWAPRGPAAEAQWDKLQAGLGVVDAWYAKNGEGRGEGFLLGGTTPSWGDFVVVSYLLWVKITLGEDSKQWRDIVSWHDGRWKWLLESLKEYQN